jgi:HEPN domain-containing protein
LTPKVYNPNKVRVRQDTENWVALAEYDMKTARRRFATGRHLYVIFLCHLSLEKMLKAHVTEVTQGIAAKTHDLIYLVKSETKKSGTG